jgi:hypothetical protein
MQHHHQQQRQLHQHQQGPVPPAGVPHPVYVSQNAPHPLNPQAQVCVVGGVVA